jgi:dienelactone hydrolase
MEQKDQRLEIPDSLLYHIYKYDQSLPLLATSEEELVIDPNTRSRSNALKSERVTFSSTHDQRVLATITRANTDEISPAVIFQHGSTPLGRFSWSNRQKLIHEWALNGLTVVAVDAYGFGSRELPDDRGRLRPQRPDLLFRTRDQRIQAVQDLMRTIDYLQERDDIDSNCIGYLGISMGTRVGVPFMGLDTRVKVGAFFVGGSGAYARFDTSGKKWEHLAADEIMSFNLTDPARFAGLTTGRETLCANGKGDLLVGPAAAERLQDAFSEPHTNIWFDGGHGETPDLVFQQARQLFTKSFTSN